MWPKASLLKETKRFRRNRPHILSSVQKMVFCFILRKIQKKIPRAGLSVRWGKGAVVDDYKMSFWATEDCLKNSGSTDVGADRSSSRWVMDSTKTNFKLRVLGCTARTPPTTSNGIPTEPWVRSSIRSSFSDFSSEWWLIAIKKYSWNFNASFTSS